MSSLETLADFLVRVFNEHEWDESCPFLLRSDNYSKFTKTVYNLGFCMFEYCTQGKAMACFGPRSEFAGHIVDLYGIVKDVLKKQSKPCAGRDMVSFVQSIGFDHVQHCMKPNFFKDWEIITGRAEDENIEIPDFTKKAVEDSLEKFFVREGNEFRLTGEILDKNVLLENLKKYQQEQEKKKKQEKKKRLKEEIWRLANKYGYEDALECMVTLTDSPPSSSSSSSSSSSVAVASFQKRKMRPETGSSKISKRDSDSDSDSD
jgi:hypothetical protein